MGLYVAPDGNYGDSEDIVIVNNESFDEHFYGYLDNSTDWLRPLYASWFEQNDHDFEQSEDLPWACSICEKYLEEERNN
jgi:hypothetical protein